MSSVSADEGFFSRFNPMRSSRAANTQPTQTPRHEVPSVDQMRSQMAAQGMDQATSDACRAQMTEHQANPSQHPSMHQQGTNGGFDRSQMQHTGIEQGNRPEQSSTRGDFGGGMRRGGR